MSNAANRVLKNFSLFVDGRSYAGQIDEIQLPTLANKVEDYRAGGMDSSVALSMGMEKMEAKFTLSGFEPELLKLWGLAEGNTKILVARGAVEGLTGTVEPVAVTMGGTVRSVEPSAWQGGNKATIVYTVDLRTYKYEQAGSTVHDIDVINMKKLIGGVDQLAEQRKALGL